MKHNCIIIGCLIITCPIFGQIQNLTDLPGEFLEEQSQVCPDPVRVYEDSARLPLRKFVLDQMGDLTGKTIIDIGAGPGFFAFEMAKNAKKVIATELDDLFLKYMFQKSQVMRLSNFEVRKADDRQSELSELRVNYALMVHVFHYLHDPKLFLSRLTDALTPGAKIFIINAHLSPVIIKDYLVNAGWINLEETSFTYETSGCGSQEVSLITGNVPE